MTSRESEGITLPLKRNATRAWEINNDGPYSRPGTVREQIVALLKNTPMQPVDVARALGKSPDSVRMMLKRLKDQGEVKRNENGTYALDYGDMGPIFDDAA